MPWNIPTEAHVTKRKKPGFVRIVHTCWLLCTSGWYDSVKYCLSPTFPFRSHVKRNHYVAHESEPQFGLCLQIHGFHSTKFKQVFSQKPPIVGCSKHDYKSYLTIIQLSCLSMIILTIISNYLLFILSLNSWLVKTSMSYLKKSSPGILGPPLSVRILSRYQSMAKTLGLERTVFLGPKGYLAT